MKVDYRRRLENGECLVVGLTVPDEQWERVFDYCNQYFCAGMPELVPPARVAGAGLHTGGVRRGKR